ncbi:hypothetical protein P8C59_007377 [Phyllachora maydis]|uniref:Reverse transcriptase Ty1/copia-type domain-containing protein n=1 Tax=Phyllachora maydis TaxID=1825666 RepID=A0AAD9MGT4_9PEZI|nr:hypothetical protein P8C59_007377 [Phyllachora maydis]
MQLDYYKLLAKTSSYILSFVYKARKRVISKDSTPTTYKQVLKLPKDERSKWLEAITKEFIQLLELGVFKFLPRSLLPSNRKLITCRNALKVKKDAKNRPIKYKSRLVARGFMQVEGLDYTITYASTRAFLNSALREEIYMEIPEGLLDLAASNKAIYKLLLKYGYNPSTPNIIKLSKALYNLGVFYNAKTCHFIVTYIDDCLFIGPNIGYITDLKKRLNKVYAIEDLGPAAYFLGVQIIRDRPNRRLWLNQSQYIEEAVSRFNLADSKPISIPLQPGLVKQSSRPTRNNITTILDAFFAHIEALPSLNKAPGTAVAAPAKAADAAAAKPAKPANTAAAEPAKAANAAAVPTAAAKAATAEPTGASAAAATVVDDIDNAISPIVFALSTYTALYTKAKAKAKEKEKEEKEEEEEEEEEDKEVVEEKEDIEGRGKEDKVLVLA